MKTPLLAALTAAACLLPAAQAATVKMECLVSANERAFCEYIQNRFESETDHSLEFVELPNSSNDKLGLFQQLFASGQSGTVDVFQADVIWPGILSQHMMDLTEHLGHLEPEFFPATWQNNVIDGQLKAIPGFIDAGMLFYRSDLLEQYGETVPQTWAEMTRIAERIQQAERDAGNEGFWGYVFQGKAYEGLTCNALEWVASYGGGRIVDDNGNITINNAGAAEALQTAAGWIGTIAPRGVMGYEEEQARAVFQNGDALFMRNWPYAYALSQADGSPIQGDVGIAPLPSGNAEGQHAAALGGWQWAVSRYTEHPEASLALMRLLASAEAQTQRFLTLGLTPARADVYDDPRVTERAPHMSQLLTIFESAVARPSSPTGNNYARVSNAFFNSTFEVLNGQKTGEQAVAELEARLARIKRNAW